MKITDLHLKTAHLTDLRAFYTDTFECLVTNTHSDEFTVKLGTTDVTFGETDDGSDPFYHFAINIPQNQFDDAVTWLADRTELLAHSETGDQQFIASQYSQVYCHDPAGNIVELIARHDLSNDADQPFGSENFCNISEIGLPVPNVRRAVEAINDTVGVSPEIVVFQKFPMMRHSQLLEMIMECLSS